MKNFKCLFLASILLIFSSCYQDNWLLPDANDLIQVNESNPTLQIQVDKQSDSQIGGELHVDFTADHDFTDNVVVGTQTLDFQDALQNAVSLTFSVNSYIGSNDAVSVTYAIGSHDLTGLILIGIQQIIIEDSTVN